MEILVAGKVIDYPSQIEDSHKAKVLELCGMKFEGVQSKRLIVFTDPETKSTLALDEKDFSRESVMNKVKESRKSFGLAV